MQQVYAMNDELDPVQPAPNYPGQILELQAKLNFAHCELGRWRKDYDRLQRKTNALEKIAELCWEEMNHGFDLPSEVFEAVEKYYGAKNCPST